MTLNPAKNESNIIDTRGWTVLWNCSKLSRKVCMELCRWCEYRYGCDDIPENHGSHLCGIACEKFGKCYGGMAGWTYGKRLRDLMYAEAECNRSGHDWKYYGITKWNNEPNFICKRCWTKLKWEEFEDWMLSHALAEELKC